MDIEALDAIKKSVRTNFDVMDSWNVGADTSDAKFFDTVVTHYAKHKLIQASIKINEHLEKHGWKNIDPSEYSDLVLTLIDK